MAFPEHEKIDDTHAFAETRPMNQRDAMLRRAGFRIAARPSKGPTLWLIDGKLWTESEAVEYAMAMEAERKKGKR